MIAIHETKSAMFKAVAYNDTDKILTIVFNNGGEYDYLDVPQEVFNQLLGAESEGKFFLASIKPCFKCEKK